MVQCLATFGTKPNEVASAITKFPHIFSHGLEQKVCPLLAFFKTLGLTGNQLVKMLLQNPCIISNSIDSKLAGIANFLADVIGLTKEGSVGKVLVKNPSIMGYGVEKRLCPTSELLLSLGLTQIDLQKMGKLSDSGFHSTGFNMQFSNTSICNKTHYDILGVNQDASLEEIRMSYRSAILNSHPDKLHKSDKSDHDALGSRFLEIQRAWEILGDLGSRAVYDRELRILRQDEVTADDVQLEDLLVENHGDVVELLYQCRCGDYFSIDTSELAEMGIKLSCNDHKISLEAPNCSPASVVLPCGSCSLRIRLLLNQHSWIQSSY